MSGKNASLTEGSGLIPPDVLMIQSVAANVDNGNKGDIELLVSGWDAREEPRDCGGVCATEYKLIFGVLAKEGARGSRDLPTTRSGPTVREMGSRIVSGGLLSAFG